MWPCTKKKRTDILFLGMATLYALLIPLKGSLTLFDGVVFLGIYVGYMCIIARRPCEEEEPEGPAATLAKLSRPARMRAVAGLFLFAALVILFNAEPFSESLVVSGKILGINEFLLVQWLAPIASEAPEFIVALMFAFRGNAGLALGSLLSSKLNQWTLLVGMIPGVYAVSSGGTTPINLDPHQFQEIFLTAGQSIFAVALLLDLRLGLREAAALLVFFLAQLFSPFYDVQLEALLGLPHDPLRLHNFYAWTYPDPGGPAPAAALAPGGRTALRLPRQGPGYRASLRPCTPSGGEAPYGRSSPCPRRVGRPAFYLLPQGLTGPQEPSTSSLRRHAAISFSVVWGGYDVQLWESPSSAGILLPVRSHACAGGPAVVLRTVS